MKFSHVLSGAGFSFHFLSGLVNFPVLRRISYTVVIIVVTGWGVP